MHLSPRIIKVPTLAMDDHNSVRCGACLVFFVLSIDQHGDRRLRVCVGSKMNERRSGRNGWKRFSRT